MTLRPSRLARRAAHRVVDFLLSRFAMSEWMMSAGYDGMNESNFSRLSLHEEMLNDRVRVDAYHRGLHRGVAAGDVVIDVGSGTGLLAFFARRAGASLVYAVDHSDFIEVAREIGQRSGIDGVEFVRASSRDFTPPRPVDVLVHEQMGDELFNENMLETLLDLRDRALASGGRIIPGRFRLYVEPVSFHEAFRVRRLWRTEVPDGIDLTATRSALARWDDGRMEVIWVRPGSVASVVGEPLPLLEFDLHTLESADVLPLVHEVERIARTDAIIDGFCVWFEAIFDDEVVLSTSPLGPLTSWGNRMFRLDQDVHTGDVIRYRVDLGILVEPSTWAVRVL